MTRPTEILESILAALREANVFELVTLGSTGTTGSIPRAELHHDGLETFTPDDTAETRWVRLRARLVIRTRAVPEAQAIRRLSELCDAAAAAIAGDPHRGGLCSDLPVGPATAVERTQPDRNQPDPLGSASLGIRCHYEEPLNETEA